MTRSCASSTMPPVGGTQDFCDRKQYSDANTRKKDGHWTASLGMAASQAKVTDLAGVDEYFPEVLPGVDAERGGDKNAEKR